MAAGGANWTELSKFANYDFETLMWRAGREGNRDPEKRDFEPFRSEFSYNLQPLQDWRRVAVSLGHARDALEPARLACNLDAQECFDLVGILRANGLVEEAFHVAEKAFKDVGDTVAASGEAYWLTDEYVRRGRLSSARDLAERVAGTGSYIGVLTLARLHEREGHYDDAVRLRRQLDSRYDDTSEKEFQIRRLARTAPGKKAEIEKALSEIVESPAPGGLNPINAFLTESWLNTRGLVFRNDIEGMGLRVGDVIIEVNGIRVTNLSQVRVALSFSDVPEVTFTVSRGSNATASGHGVAFSGKLDRISYEPIH